MVKGDTYGVWRKFYEPPTEDVIKQAMNEMKEELSSTLDSQDDYDVEFINKNYHENGVIPVWTIALKATKKVAK